MNSIKKPQHRILRWIILCVVMIAIACNLYYLTVWYRIPHKKICYDLNIAGCIGYPVCNIYLGMDYSDSDTLGKQQLGAILSIKHPFMKQSPLLFMGVVDNIYNENRKDRYREYYEPLYKYNSLLCNKISTVYSTHIDLYSNLYDDINSNDTETWSDDQLLTIRRFKQKKIKQNHINSECWYYLQKLPDSHPCDEGFVIFNSQCFNTYDHLKPNFKSKGDISKLDCTINLRLDSRIECDSVIINTLGPVNLISINIQPDSLSFNKIMFYDKNKISQIRKSELRFYAEFPEAQKIQNIRIAVLLLILPFLLTLLFKLLKDEILIIMTNLKSYINSHKIIKS